jgi:hypothetical protein
LRLGLGLGLGLGVGLGSGSGLVVGIRGANLGWLERVQTYLALPDGNTTY